MRVAPFGRGREKQCILGIHSFIPNPLLVVVLLS